MTTKVQSLVGVEDLMSSRKIGDNTFRLVYKDGDKAIRLHRTNVVTFHPARYVLNTDGWQTRTSKERINGYIPNGGYISQRKGVWYVSTPDGEVEYYDGIMFDYEGNHCECV